MDWSEENDGSELVDSKGQFISPNNQPPPPQQQQQQQQQDNNPQGKALDENDKNKKKSPKEVPLDFDPDRN